MTGEQGRTHVTQTITEKGITRLERRRFRLVGRLDGRVVGDATFADEAVTIGAAAEASFSIDDASVSRLHCRIEEARDGLAVTDLDSTNGTLVDGIRVVSAYLPIPATLTVGRCTVDLTLTDQTEPVPLSQRSSMGRLFGDSIAMRRLYHGLETAASSDLTVLLQGETGTGKELAAEAIHEGSHRSGGPFVVVDCGALQPQLIESELFGHVRGAFTGAVSTRAGVFEQADGGTVFIDEIGELDLALQTRLLRVLESRQVKRVGEEQYRSVDVRVIAATHRDLEAMVSNGEFRADLFYRMAVVRIRIPPLRERLEDIETIAFRVLDELSVRIPGAANFEMSPQMIRALRRRHWHGNVRELRNVIERAVFLDTQQVPDDDRPALDASGGAPSILFDHTYAIARDAWVGHFEREYLTSALDANDWNVAATARNCQVDRAYLFRLIKKHDLKRPS